jgi:hypothetical protein
MSDDNVGKQIVVRNVKKTCAYLYHNLPYMQKRVQRLTSENIWTGEIVGFFDHSAPHWEGHPDLYEIEFDLCDGKTFWCELPVDMVMVLDFSKHKDSADE